MKKIPLEIQEAIAKKFEDLAHVLNERSRRLWAATEANALGPGGIACVARATGLNANTIAKGIKELEDPGIQAEYDQIRHPGRGRKPLEEIYPDINDAIEKLVESDTRGDPESPLKWTTKSVARLTKELRKQGYKVCPMSVWRLLKKLGYNLRAISKENEGKQHPDRNAQFEHINRRILEMGEKGQPVISVDAKNKENVGNYANSGVEWCWPDRPLTAGTHDFPNPIMPKAAPYGIFDVFRNDGWVSVGVSSDTAEFASNSIYSWWREMGRKAYPDATELLIIADSGGSNSNRGRLWKLCLQDLANRTGLTVYVCHFPPGTSKWNKIEHRMFSEISKNWRGRILESYQVVVECIKATKTNSGLKIKAKLDARQYETGIKVSDEEMESVNLFRDEFHGEWNYAVTPHS